MLIEVLVRIVDGFGGECFRQGFGRVVDELVMSVYWS
jgi:hypothetical protein